MNVVTARPQLSFITDRSKAVLLIWFSTLLFYVSYVGGSDVVSVNCFGVRFSVMSHFMFVHNTFSSVLVAEWPPFGK